MERLRNVFATIRASLGRLDSSQKLLIGSLTVVLLMTLFVVQQYAGSPAMSPLLGAGYAADDQQAAVEYLQANHIDYKLGKDGVVLIPTERRTLVLAQMSQKPGALPSDKTLLFKNLIDKQSWTKSTMQNRQLEVIALQNEVSYILSQWAGIKSASVILDVPDRPGLGQPARAPTAAVNVFSDGGLDQHTVDAIANFVAGVRAGLTPDRVRIVDGTTNRQYRASEEGELTATTALELQAKIERRRQDQISEMLSYIPGVIVAVYAQVDATQREAKVTTFDKEGDGTVSVLASEQTKQMQTTESTSGAEPGVRANTGADISTVGGGKTGTTDNTSDTTYETQFGRRDEHIVDPRGVATKINAVVNIPRPYFVSIWKAQESRKAAAGGAGAGAGGGAAPAAGAEPTDTQLDPIVQSEVTRIQGEVEKLIDTSGAEQTTPGEVKVSMIPVMPGAGTGPAGAKTKPAGLFGVGTVGDVGGIAMDELVKTGALGGLAVLALGLVVFTAVKANKREELPTAEELVGIPPALDADDDIVGEAEAAEPALAGIELSDDAMKERQVLEQVQGMIVDNPSDAARLVTRWIREHE